MDAIAKELAVGHLRAAANAPEVHAAALIAAKDLLLGRPELASLTSDTAAVTIGMHAAVLFRAYLEFIGTDGLVPPPPAPEPHPED